VTVKNLAASVQARLQNHARATKRPFQELLQYYAMERFLYRLSKTPYRVSPSASVGTTSTGINGAQGPTRWRADGSSP